MFKCVVGAGEREQLTNCEIVIVPRPAVRSVSVEEWDDLHPDSRTGVNGRARAKMDLSSRGLDCIKSYESLSLSAYDDGAGYQTIGYGHKIVDGEDFSGGIKRMKKVTATGTTYTF